MTPLEQEIKQIIEEEICGKYVGKLQVNEEYDEFARICLFELLLHMNQEQAPLHLGYQGDEEGFKDYIRQEFHFRRKNDVHFWRAIREYIESPLDMENNIFTL